MLLTAQREGEVAGMRWSELDLEDRFGRFRASDKKRQAAYRTPEPAGDRNSGMGSAHRRRFLVFRNWQNAGFRFSSAKARIDELMLKALRDDAEQIGLAPWVLHDLRRTATTDMARLNVPPYGADKILNHQAGTICGAAATYNRFEYLDERRAALEAWGRFVESLCGSRREPWSRSYGPLTSGPARRAKADLQQPGPAPSDAEGRHVGTGTCQPLKQTA